MEGETMTHRRYVCVDPIWNYKNPWKIRCVYSFQVNIISDIAQTFFENKTMKSILVVFALCLVSAMALTDEQKAKLTQYKKDCITETGVESKAVDDAKAGNYNEQDEKLGCFSACMLKKIGIMNQDGTINEETARQKAPAGVTKEQLDEIAEKCKDVTGPNDCKKAANLVKCFKEHKTFSVFN